MSNGVRKTRIKIILLSFAALAIVGYSCFQARNLILGPQIDIQSPLTGNTLNTPLVAIAGIAKNVSFISLNDHQIFVDKNGNFSEDLLLSPGYNLWTIKAEDKFGRTISKKIELILNKT